jgi:hypothetical protein
MFKIHFSKSKNSTLFLTAELSLGGLGLLDPVTKIAIPGCQTCDKQEGKGLQEFVMARKNAFYAQSGGVTAVINASACGVLETAREHSDEIGKVYAGRNGIIGAESRSVCRNEPRDQGADTFGSSGSECNKDVEGLSQRPPPERPPRRAVLDRSTR